MNLKHFVAAVLQDVCELPDYNSPEDQPDVVSATVAELSLIVERHAEPLFARLAKLEGTGA